MTTNHGFEDVPELLALSLEERLRHVRECCRLLADFFNIQAEATLMACEATLSTDAYNALTGLCNAAADELEQLVRQMPAGLANWHPGIPGGDRV